MMMTGNIWSPSRPLVSGGFTDTRAGHYMGHAVAVKTLRVGKQEDIQKIRKVSASNIFSMVLTILQQFCKEVVLWNTLSHPNVLKFVGVQGDMEKGQFTIVSEWMPHGNIMEFIKNKPVNRLELVRHLTFSATSFT